MTKMHGHYAAVVVLLLLLPGCLDAYPDEVVIVDVGALEEGISCHFPVTAPVVPESLEARRQHYRAIQAKDLARHRQLAAGTRRRQLAASDIPELLAATSGSGSGTSSLSTFELPMQSALDSLSVGMYLVTVQFGTPAVAYSMALDTANGLTWLNCRLRGHRRHRDRGKGKGKGKTMSLGDTLEEPPLVNKTWYRPARSSSWRRYRCSQRDTCGNFPYVACKTPDHNESCSYKQMLQDGTVTRGIFGRETATVSVSGGRQARLPGLVLGCSTYEAGGTVDAHDGVLTLGNQHVSFGNIAGQSFQGLFSFCLLATHSGRDASSYLTFGPNPAIEAGGVAGETDIIYVTNMPTMGVQVTGVLVNGQRLDNIPPEVWNYRVHGGLNLDTGTSVSSLVEPAYGIVTRALARHLDPKLEKVSDVIEFEHCYKWDGVKPAPETIVPKLELVLQGGARMEPSLTGVLMPEVVPGVACLGFWRRELGPSVLGNVHMQEHIWEFDSVKGKLRFKKDKCTTHVPPANPSSSNHIPNPNPNPTKN
ncbi:aspartic proteinase NANA, chloroplast-like [Hordeum vulgare subsp. vulgare]|uniref:Peptidase A1 domain-containing protein n=1 Tax=Hordeum vulgare subsp. vulgare TaxID=112509 RepID=A0A8I6WVZ8_HORVV|nr:aspartic proteinase NANA, chloroplast-like [Hordeum vulgare subsp. vulgare]